MLLKKEVKAGILLYALLMLAIFSLLLQFYLRRQSASTYNLIAQEKSSQAYLMAQLTADNVDVDAKKKSGQMQFDEGSSSYQISQNMLEVTVTDQDGQTYTYHFPLSGESP